MGPVRGGNKRARWLGVLKIGVSLGLLGWLLARMVQREGIGALLERLHALDGRWIALAIAIHGVAVIAGVARWRLLLRAAGVELSFAWLARSFLVGRFVGAFTPSRAGLDGWRIWDAGRASGAMGKSAAVIVVEKLVGLIGMALVCASLVPFGGAALLGPSAIVIALVMASGAAVGLVVIRNPAWLEPLVRRVPRARKVVDALASARLTGAQLGGSVALGVASHHALSAVFFATAGALGLEVSAWTLLAVGNAIVLAVLLPVSVGGVGVREGVAVVLLASAGVASSDAVLVALLGYLTGQVPALAGGLLMALRRSERQAAQPALAEQTLS